MMRERLLIAGVCLLFFLIFAITPVIPILLESYDITNTFAVRAAVGIATLLCSVGFAWSLFSDPEKKNEKNKDGKLHLRLPLVIIGLALILIAWFTNIPLWLSEMSGLDNMFEFGNEIMEGGLGTRLMTSVFTSIGVICFRFSTFREKDDNFRPSVDEHKYNQMVENNRNPGDGMW